MDRPLFLPVMDHPDVRGSHTKFFGFTPDKLLLENYNIREVFMTTNNKNTVRGMHFQTPPQTKIIQAITGSVVGNIICCNPDSDSFGEVVHYTLSASENTRIVVPGDWALGYRSLEDNTCILYFADADFSGAGDTGIDPFDSDLKLRWTRRGEQFSKEEAILSQKDQELDSWKTFSNNNKGAFVAPWSK